MLLLKPEDLKQIADQAEAAYPREACGLLLGFQRVDGNIEVTRVAESENKAAPARNDRFEIDPELRLRLMRDPATFPRHINIHDEHIHIHFLNEIQNFITVFSLTTNHEI